MRYRLLPCLLVAACAPADAPGRDTTGTRAPDTAAVVRDGPVTVHRVHIGQRGMVGMLRWTLSPDSSALLAVEDWASIEAEPFHDAYLLASERTGAVVQGDSVWDVAPSPDWSALALGMATIVHTGRTDTLTPDSLAAVAARLGVTVDEARAAEFPASGMGPASGFAQLAVRPADGGPRRALGVLAGWRVRWTPDGSSVVAGLGPRFAQDDAASTVWVSVPLAGDSARRVTGAPDTASVAWVDGPTIDMSVEPDTGAISLAGGMVRSGGGTLTVDGRIIGPGIAMAATRHACYVLALVPDSTAGEYDPSWRAAVYDTGCSP